VLLSKLRHGLGADHLRGRAAVELLLPLATFVDVEAALEGAHRAESTIAEGRWAQAWGPAGIAYHVATRPFLSGLESPWIDEWPAPVGGGPASRAGVLRRRPGPWRPGAGAGRGARQDADRAGALRETAHRLLMEALERRGNPAEALRAYERLRTLLREELGAAPSPAMQAVHRRLLGADR
jgi:hypothetical protein